jgi:hypothetical protein
MAEPLPTPSMQTLVATCIDCASVHVSKSLTWQAIDAYCFGKLHGAYSEAFLQVYIPLWLYLALQLYQCPLLNAIS